MMELFGFIVDVGHITRLATIGLVITLTLSCYGELELPPHIEMSDPLPQEQISRYSKLCSNNGLEHKWQNLSGKRISGEFVKVLGDGNVQIRYIYKGDFKYICVPLDSLTTENLLYVMIRSKSLLPGVVTISDSEFEHRLEVARAWCYLIRFSQNSGLKNQYLDKYNEVAKSCRDRIQRHKRQKEVALQERLEKEMMEHALRAEIENAKAKAERDRAERQRELERVEELKRRELESQRGQIQGMVANMVAERVNAFLCDIYDGLDVRNFFTSDSSHRNFMYDGYFSNPVRSWNIHERMILGTPVNTPNTGIPMARVKVDYLGYTYNVFLEYGETSRTWYISIIRKVTYVDSPPNWQEMPLSPFISLGF